jgi:hypothetical protein
VKHVDHVVDSRKIDNAIPPALVLIPEFKNARVNRRQRPVVPWPLTLLKLPQFKSKVLYNRFRKTPENLFRIAFLDDFSELWPFRFVAHKHNTKCVLNIHKTVYSIAPLASFERLLLSSHKKRGIMAQNRAVEYSQNYVAGLEKAVRYISFIADA